MDVISGIANTGECKSVVVQKDGAEHRALRFQIVR